MSKTAVGPAPVMYASRVSDALVLSRSGYPFIEVKAPLTGEVREFWENEDLNDHEWNAFLWKVYQNEIRKAGAL